MRQEIYRREEALGKIPRTQIKVALHMIHSWYVSFHFRKEMCDALRIPVRSCVPTPPLLTAAVQSVATVCTRAMYRNTAVCLRQGGTPVNNASVGSVTPILTFCHCLLICIFIFLSSILPVTCNYHKTLWFWVCYKYVFFYVNNLPFIIDN